MRVWRGKYKLLTGDRIIAACTLFGLLYFIFCPSPVRIGDFPEFLTSSIFFIVNITYFLFTLMRFVFSARNKELITRTAFVSLNLFASTLFFTNPVTDLFWNLRFFFLKPVYASAVSDILSQSKQKSFKYSYNPENAMTYIELPLDFWYIGGGNKSAVQYGKDGENTLVLFNETGFLFRYCGYLYASQNVVPDMGFFDFGFGSRGGFSRIQKNWFFGCITYD